MAQPQPDKWEPVWEEPPETHVERMLWLTRLQALVKKKGKWALIADYPEEEKPRAHQLRSALHRRRYKIPLPDHQWEFTTRTGKVYARYVGPADATE